jgi:hypothetical protein
MKTKDSSELQDQGTPRGLVLPLRLALLTTLLALVALGACRSGDIFSGSDDPPDVCENEFAEPLINITSVVDQETGDPIETVLLDSIMIGLARVTNYNVLLSPDSTASTPAYGVAATPDHLICDVPCGFAIFEGDWQLRIFAAGYEARMLDLGAVHYSDVTDTCPLRHRGAFHFETDLRPIN